MDFVRPLEHGIVELIVIFWRISSKGQNESQQYTRRCKEMLC